MRKGAVDVHLGTQIFFSLQIASNWEVRVRCGARSFCGAWQNTVRWTPRVCVCMCVCVWCGVCVCVYIIHIHIHILHHMIYMYVYHPQIENTSYREQLTLALPQHMCISPEHEHLQQVSDLAHTACVGLRIAH